MQFNFLNHSQLGYEPKICRNKFWLKSIQKHFFPTQTFPQSLLDHQSRAMNLLCCFISTSKSGRKLKTFCLLPSQCETSNLHRSSFCSVNFFHAAPSALASPVCQTKLQGNVNFFPFNNRPLSLSSSSACYHDLAFRAVNNISMNNRMQNESDKNEKGNLSQDDWKENFSTSMTWERLYWTNIKKEKAKKEKYLQ